MLFIWHAVKVQTKQFSTFFTIKSLKISMPKQMFFDFDVISLLGKERCTSSKYRR